MAVVPESPWKPEVVDLIEQLDAYQGQLYPPESNHLLDLASLSKADIRFFVARAGTQALGCGAL